MSATARVGAVVLAGGRSSRFGRDKLAEPIDGRPMLDHAIDAVWVLAQEVIVVATTGSPLTPSGGVRIVTDPIAFEGPLAGLVTGLRAHDPTVEHVLVVGGDMPTLVPAVLDRMLQQLDDHELAVLAEDERPRPLPMAIRRSAGLDAAERLLEDGERRLRALLQVLETTVIPAAAWRTDDPEGATLRDVDEPGDLPG